MGHVEPPRGEGPTRPKSNWSLVDRWSAGLLNRRILRADDFQDTAEGGVLLGREAMRRYFPAWEEELATPFAVDGEEATYRKFSNP